MAPQKNVVEKRMNITIQEMETFVLDESRTSNIFCYEASYTMVNILNKSHICVNNDKTPYQLLYGKHPTPKH